MYFVQSDHSQLANWFPQTQLGYMSPIIQIQAESYVFVLEYL